jgi:hypothetical protein
MLQFADEERAIVVRYAVRRAADERELAAFHSITSSARASSVTDTSRPSNGPSDVTGIDAGV